VAPSPMVFDAPFCGKAQQEVEKLIASEHHRSPPTSHHIGARPGVPLVYICNECIDSCCETLHQSDQMRGTLRTALLPSPNGSLPTQNNRRSGRLAQPDDPLSSRHSA
jgi:hypothetical protein